MKFRRVRDLKKSNSGNKMPRSKNQILSAIARMILDNPLKKPFNQVMQSQRMMGNRLWKQRKKELIKQQPSV